MQRPACAPAAAHPGRPRKPNTELLLELLQVTLSFIFYHHRYLLYINNITDFKVSVGFFILNCSCFIVVNQLKAKSKLNKKWDFTLCTNCSTRVCKPHTSNLTVTSLYEHMMGSWVSLQPSCSIPRDVFSDLKYRKSYIESQIQIPHISNNCKLRMNATATFSDSNPSRDKIQGVYTS